VIALRGKKVVFIGINLGLLFHVKELVIVGSVEVV